MEDSISKSQKKRDAITLQKIGVELIELPVAKLNELPLSDPLRRAIIEAKNIKSHGARRRQSQLIGKLMRQADSDAILASWENMKAEENAKTSGFHELEHWRDRLLNEGRPAITEFISLFPNTDVQKLRQLIKQSVNETISGKSVGAAKALFRFLRSCSE
jgi:ribosome-associated protein